MKSFTVAVLAIALAILPIAKADTLECGSRKTLYPGDTYTIQSPNFPENYPARAKCKIMFKVDKTCKEPQFVCEEFDVRGNPPSCKGGDRLQVKTKKPKQRRQISKFCGDEPVSFSAPGSRVLSILFRSNWRNQGSGYSCQVSCGGTTDQTSDGGTTTEGPPASMGPCNCGLANRVNRIVGGVETEANEYPWQVGLVPSFGGNVPVCGGSLISSTTVLTAAHCTDGASAGSYVVRVGEHDTTIKDGEFDVRVKQIIQHPDYNSANVDNDFALLILENAVEWSDSVQPVCLPAKLKEDYEDVDAIVSGWGTTSFGGQLSSTLQEVDVVTMTNSACTSGKSQYSSSQITDNMLCAAEKDMNGGKDACQGDSGGPLITKETDESYSQIGVVSWGSGCAQANSPGVYSRVTEQLTWITKNMQGDTCPMM